MLEPETTLLASPRQASLALLWQIDPAGERLHNEQAVGAVDFMHGAAYVGVRA
jgi:hypothetical protein